MSQPVQLTQQSNSSIDVCKSFSTLFKQQSSAASPVSDIQVKLPSSFRGKPAVFFSNDEVHKLAAPLRFALIGKFSHGKPKIAEIRSSIDSIGIKGSHTTGVIDHKHILIRFSHEEDYQKFWCKEQWQIKKHPMRVFKWSPEFSPDHESPLFPIWITLPGLPLHFYSKSALFSIGCNLGTPMKIDQATSNLIRPSLARMCIEMNVTDDLPSSIWIGSEEEHDHGFWQDIVYEEVPLYCNTCYKLGHGQNSCFITNPNSAPKKSTSAPTVKKSDASHRITNDSKKTSTSFVKQLSNSKIYSPVYVQRKGPAGYTVVKKGIPSVENEVNVGTAATNNIDQVTVDLVNSDIPVSVQQIESQIDSETAACAANDNELDKAVDNDAVKLLSTPQAAPKKNLATTFSKINGSKSAPSYVPKPVNKVVNDSIPVDSQGIIQTFSNVDNDNAVVSSHSAVPISATLELDTSQSLEDNISEQQFMAGEWDYFIPGEKTSDIFKAIPSLIDNRRLQSRNYITAMDLHVRSCKVNFSLSLDELKLTLPRDSASIASAILSKFPIADEAFTPVTRRRKKKKQSPARTSVVTRATAKTLFSFPPKP